MELPASRAYYEGRDTRHIREYVEEFLAFGRDEFAKKYPHAMLLVAGGGEAEENAEFRTAVMTREAMAALRAEVPGVGGTGSTLRKTSSPKVSRSTSSMVSTGWNSMASRT